MIGMLKYLTEALGKEERREWKILAVLNFIRPVMDIFSFSVIIYIVNIVIREQSVSTEIVVFTFFMGIMSIIKGFFELYKCKVQNQFLYDGAQKLSMKLCELMTKESLVCHNRKSAMQVITLVRSDAQNTMSIIISCVEILINILTIVGYYIVMIYATRWIGVVSCVVFTFFMFGMFLVHRRQMKLYGEESRAYAIKANAQVTIAYGNFKEMKISDNSDMVLHKYKESSIKYAQVQKKYQYNRNMIGMIMQSTVMTAIFIVLLCILLYPMENIGLLFTSMTIYFTMLVKMIPMANSIVSGFNNVEFAKTSYEKIREELIEYERIKKNEEILKGIRRKELTFKRGLFIRNLTFAYNEQTKVFQEASIDIPVGFSIAVIGISGIGKTTFLDLILGLLTPQSGSILYDDYDIVTHMDQKGKCIGNIGSVACYIPQTVYLNGETIRNNVAFYINESDIDELKVEECLKCAQVWDDVMRMPDGLDTLIGENGISISGGQRQRIALARALYSDFEILIMDEATAALDMETEKAVLDSIRQIKGNKTLLIATHHMSLANECDMIYKIEECKFRRLK